ncbi:MAG: hypothetical protein L0H93_14385, partial [Nocardioides sp.]|nr:hypothetical protein [Nocardioides sp.]
MKHKVLVASTVAVLMLGASGTALAAGASSPESAPVGSPQGVADTVSYAKNRKISKQRQLDLLALLLAGEGPIAKKNPELNRTGFDGGSGYWFPTKV